MTEQALAVHSRDRKHRFLQARQVKEIGYWTMAELILSMEENEDWKTEGDFQTLYAYSAAPVESGGLGTPFSNYGDMRRYIRNGYFLRRCKPLGVEEKILAELGRTKAEVLYQREIPDDALPKLIAEATDASREDVIGWFEKEGSKDNRRPPSIVTCPECGERIEI
jgi:hypothetical protein|tara:strand:+ start:2775 stop:3272 length:498 start_codon:yes stop_codon:yes gene_type:complete